MNLCRAAVSGHSRILGLLLLAITLLLAVQPAPASAEGCRILITARGHFWGRILDHGYTPFTRFAVTVEHDIQDVRWQMPAKGPYLGKCPAEAEDAHSVELASAHESEDALMYLFLFIARRSAQAARGSGTAPEIDATIKELEDASRQLQKKIVGNGAKKVGIGIASDLASLSGLGWAEKQVVGYLGDVANEAVTGGNGSSIEGRLRSLALGRMTEGLSDADARKVMGEVINLGLRTCGNPDTTPDLRGRISNNRLQLDPGAGAAFTASIVEITPSGTILHHDVSHARTGGLDPVTDAGEATAAGIGGPVATLTFQVADIKEDKEYPFQVFLAAAGRAAAPIDAKVIVQNVAPRIDPPRLSVEVEPNELMTLSGQASVRKTT